MNHHTKLPQTLPNPIRTGYTMSGTYIDNPSKVQAWHERWEAEFRAQRWTESNGKFYPRKP